MAAERQRAAPNEPDRLEGFSAPREVDRLFGHDAAIAEFGEALRSGRLHHAWLLGRTGGRRQGDARLSLRRDGAAARCDGAIADAAIMPCSAKSPALSHPNLLVLTARLEREDQALSAMDRRRRGRAACAAFLGNSAGEGGWRVVIVDRADELNQNAANALLKALEEPPPRTLFLLIASAEGRLPVTIRSRTRTLQPVGSRRWRVWRRP